MTPAAENPTYVAAVLTLYLDLPDTPLRPSPPRSMRWPADCISKAFPCRWSKPLCCWLSAPPDPPCRPPATAADPLACLLPARHRRTSADSPYPTATSTTFASSSASSPGLAPAASPEKYVF